MKKSKLYLLNGVFSNSRNLLVILLCFIIHRMPANPPLDSIPFLSENPVVLVYRHVNNTSSLVNTVKIGTQEWMAEDIRVTTYNNGQPISEALTAEQWVAHASKKEGCFRKLTNGGVLYNGYVLTDPRGIVPEGFQLPTADDFGKLQKFLGGGNSKGGKATTAMAGYTINFEEWVDTKGGGDFRNVTVKGVGKNGFNAREGGYVYDHGETGEWVVVPIGGLPQIIKVITV